MIATEAQKHRILALYFSALPCLCGSKLKAKLVPEIDIKDELRFKWI